MNAVPVLYIAVLISTHQSLGESLTSLLILLIHDFAQHMVISSHRCDTLIMETVKNRAFISAIAGVELLLLNMCIVSTAFFMPLLSFYQQFLEERYGRVTYEYLYLVVVRTLQKLYEQGSLRDIEVLIGFLSCIPTAVVQVCAYWFAGVSYSHMSLRKRIHGYTTDKLHIDDIITNSVVTTISLLTGQRMLRMLEAVVRQKLFSGAIEVYYHHNGGSTHRFMGYLICIFTNVYDLLCGIVSQLIVSIAIANRDLFGRCAVNGTIFKVLVVETLFGVFRTGMFVEWGHAFCNFGFAVCGVLSVFGVGKYAMRKYEDVRRVELRRERVLNGL